MYQQYQFDTDELVSNASTIEAIKFENVSTAIKYQFRNKARQFNKLTTNEWSWNPQEQKIPITTTSLDNIVARKQAIMLSKGQWNSYSETEQLSLIHI